MIFFLFKNKTNICNYIYYNTLYACNRSTRKIIKGLTDVFKVLSTWSCDNSIALNICKYHFMVLRFPICQLDFIYQNITTQNSTEEIILEVVNDKVF